VKQYQVTKKLQVTIPKKLAQRVGIVPGDSVAFDEVNGEITLRKVSQPHRSASEMTLALRGFASDLEKLAPRLKETKRALNENLSRHVSAK
jgi:AbrB family looped-hinge helix DNA binding protein